MKANGIILKDILDGQYEYRVPLFQRPYSWKKSNWESLWEDLIALYDEEDSESHFLGSFVTQDIQSTLGKVSSYIVIDGQQRLTTISIFFAALRDFAETPQYQKICSDAENIVEEIHDLLTNRHSRKGAYLKVLPTQIDREAYKNIITQKNIKKQPGSVYDAYRFFTKNINDLFADASRELDIERFQTVIKNKVELVHVSLGEKDNPSLIYESLNYKGQPLSQADLIRNYFFMQLPEELHDEVYKDYWLSLERRFKKPENAGDNYLIEMTNAFWYYLRKDGRAVNYKATYSALKDKVEKSKIRGGSILEEFKDMYKFSEYYLHINFPDEEPDTKLRLWFSSWSELNYSSVYPFLLNIYDDCIQGKIPFKEMELILNILESFLIRRWFVDIASGGLNKTFISLYQQLKKRGEVVDSNLLRLVLKEGERTKAWPSDLAFKKAILERPIYAETRENRRRINFVFQKVQEKISKEVVSFSNLNIEHILPRTLTPDWEEILGDNPLDKHKQWGDTLGNLTMVTSSDNSSMSNKGFSEKLENLKRSNLAINSYFKSKNSWNVNDIKERGEYLAELACQIWPR
jgi:uncharacterized protein with ParB-like and HNH nuclease domain